MFIPVVIFAQVEVPEATAEESLGDEVERALSALPAGLRAIGWEIVREGA